MSKHDDTVFYPNAGEAAKAAAKPNPPNPPVQPAPPMAPPIRNMAPIGPGGPGGPANAKPSTGAKVAKVAAAVVGGAVVAGAFVAAMPDEAGPVVGEADHAKDGAAAEIAGLHDTDKVHDVHIADLHKTDEVHTEHIVDLHRTDQVHDDKIAALEAKIEELQHAIAEKTETGPEVEAGTETNLSDPVEGSGEPDPYGNGTVAVVDDTDGGEPGAMDGGDGTVVVVDGDAPVMEDGVLVADAMEMDAGDPPSIDDAPAYAAAEVGDFVSDGDAALFA
jgi:hypothetical protein